MRTSKDLDAVRRAGIDFVHDRLVDAGERGWAGFTARFTSPSPFILPGEFDDPHRFVAKLSYQGKSFASVPVEISSIEAGNSKQHDLLSSEALALVGLPRTDAVPCMTVPWQVAQKLHACTDQPEPPRRNDRAHDLVDLQLMETLLPDDNLVDARAACSAVFEVRAKHAWPPIIVPQGHWEPIYRNAVDGLAHLGIAPSVGAAAARVQAFVRRIETSG
ncbi:MAG: nucleotidyl transferase AbiEii/AbiGii toxin family protein [Pseudonocardia sp.]|nr:nucleotidyl transferase AbiEii/AbiGii toxin family protein [Pseudonocardia sp.]